MAVILNRVARVGFIEKVAFGKDFMEVEELAI